jgi:hypothetical protein
MATQGYTDYRGATPEDGGIAGAFIAEQRQRAGFGVKNIQAEPNTYNEPDKSTITRGESWRIRGRRIQQDVNQGDAGPLQKRGNFTARKLEQLGKLKKVNARARTSGKGIKAVARINAKIIYSWTILVYFIQAFLAIVSFIAFCTAMTARSDGLFSTIIDAAGTVVEWGLWLLGFELPSWQILFFIPYSLIIIFAFFCYAFAALQFKLGGAHPFFGDTGSGIKQSTFLLGFVMYGVPFFNFFTWIWVWVWAVGRYPN